MEPTYKEPGADSMFASAKSGKGYKTKKKTRGTVAGNVFNSTGTKRPYK